MTRSWSSSVEAADEHRSRLPSSESRALGLLRSLLMRKRQPPEGQASLFAAVEPRQAESQAKRAKVAPPATPHASRTWQMPRVEGRTVAEIRVRWTKRLTPAQVARVEAELSALPKVLGKLGFGSVQVEHAFVRRRKT